MQFIPLSESVWQPVAADVDPIVPRACTLLTPAQWHAVGATWPRHLPVGLQLDNTVDVTTLGPALQQIALVVLHFPKWTDGRAYSQARLLRSRLGYRGGLRASGEVMVDMLPLLQRSGFDAVQLRAGQSEADARQALQFFAGHYQADVAPTPPTAAPAAATPESASASASARHARKTPGYEQRVAQSVALLRAAARAHAGRIVQATSLGIEGMVITDLIARHGLAVPVATLDTGMLHAQTLALIPLIEARYGIRVERHAPEDAAVQRFVHEHGALAMRQSVELRQACCALRKLQPMQRLLAGRQAWITGLRREQSEHRADVPQHERDADGRSKYYPLADWSLADIWHYAQQHALPYNTLHDEGFPSIGCAPCTRAVAPGEDFRAGRWWWEQGSARECGLHRRPQPVAA